MGTFSKIHSKILLNYLDSKISVRITCHLCKVELYGSFNK